MELNRFVTELYNSLLKEAVLVLCPILSLIIHNDYKNPPNPSNQKHTFIFFSFSGFISHCLDI